MAYSNFLHLVRVDVALSSLGVRCVLKPTPLREKSILYVLTRLFVPIPTCFDPLGNGWLFRVLRQSRKAPHTICGGAEF